MKKLLFCTLYPDSKTPESPIKQIAPFGGTRGCVDAGDPGFVAEEGEVDIDGEPRVMGTGVDMGADEVGEKQADFTRDGRIDISDLSVLSGSWDTMEGEGNWYVLSDLFEDGVIGLDDLAMFVEDWMWVAEWAD